MRRHASLLGRKTAADTEADDLRQRKEDVGRSMQKVGARNEHITVTMPNQQGLGGPEDALYSQGPQLNAKMFGDSKYWYTF